MACKDPTCLYWLAITAIANAAGHRTQVLSGLSLLMMVVDEAAHASVPFVFNSLPVAGDAYSMAKQCSFSTDILVPFHI